MKNEFISYFSSKNNFFFPLLKHQLKKKIEKSRLKIIFLSYEEKFLILNKIQQKVVRTYFSTSLIKNEKRGGKLKDRKNENKNLVESVIQKNK